MKYLIFSSLIIFLTLISCTTNQKKSIDRSTVQTQQLDSLFNFSYSNQMFNGSVLITKNDSILYKKSFGYANEISREKITSETVFYIASLSKQFTAMGIMLLQEKGKLSYEDNLNNFFPDYPKYLQNLTIKQLLNHTSGLTDKEYYKLINPGNKEVIEMLFKQDSLELESGKTFRYSNSAYVLLALIIEKITEKPIDKFFKQEIFDPLDMINTTAQKTVAQKSPKKAEGYNLLGKNVGYKSSVVGPGGIYSTINDLEKWNMALNNNRLVTKQTLEEAFKNGQLNDGVIAININHQEYGYGFGWMPFEKNGKKYVQHDGTVESYRSLIRKNLTDGYDLIYLTNHGGRLAMNELTMAVENILEHSNYQTPKIPIANKIIKEFFEKDVTIAMMNIKNDLSQNLSAYDINENSLNRLAYVYLRDQQKAKAIAIFKLNTELYATSANAFDSLAEGYFLNEQYPLAIEYYKKAIDLGGTNGNARKMIERINTIIKQQSK